MDFMIDNCYIVATGIIFAAGGVLAVIRWQRLNLDARYKMIRGWLLQAVLIAEKEFGSGTVKLKLSAVYDKFCERFGWLVKVLSFETCQKCQLCKAHCYYGDLYAAGYWDRQRNYHIR